MQEAMSFYKTVLAMTGVVVLSACSPPSEEESQAPVEETAMQDAEESTAFSAPDFREAQPVMDPLTRSGDPATDDIEYLRLLGLIRGELAAFIELYRAALYSAGMPLLPSAQSPAYAALAPAFEMRGEAGFSAELAVLRLEAEKRGDIDSAYLALSNAIAASEPPRQLTIKLLAIAEVARNAGELFGESVAEDGSIVNPIGYQRGYGYLLAARESLAGEFTSDINEAEAINLAHEQIDLALMNFPGILAAQSEGSVATIEAAAERIEMVAQRLR